jgi:hypothetical protein
VGSRYADSPAEAAGAAYVYLYDGETWIEEQRLTASNGTVGDAFGFDVAVSGDTPLVATDEFDDQTGAVYVYTIGPNAVPFIVHATGDMGDTRPFTGYVDPRLESTNGEFPDLGIDEITLVFNQPVRALGGGPLDVGSFSVTSTGGIPPSVVGVDDSENPSVRITFDSLPPLQEWTIIVANVENALCGNPIESLGNLGPGVEEPDRVDFLFLPGDVDQNEVVQPFDLLRFRQIVNEIFVPPMGIPEDYVDTNRTGEITPFDLLMYRQLINGTPPATQPWAGETANHPQP